jgi:sensor histidine kinase YesM
MNRLIFAMRVFSWITLFLTVGAVFVGGVFVLTAISRQVFYSNGYVLNNIIPSILLYALVLIFGIVLTGVSHGMAKLLQSFEAIADNNAQTAQALDALYRQQHKKNVATSHTEHTDRDDTLPAIQNTRQQPR